jgi:hypothetical protein
VNASESLAAKVETLYRLLESIATGGKYDDVEFKRVRREAVDEPILKPLLPRFVHTCRDIRAYWQHIKGLFASYQERRDYLRTVFVPIIEHLERGLTSPSSSAANDALSVIDSPHVQDAWRNAYSREESDPDGAITSARALIESVCKFILDKASEPYNDSWDLPKLYKAAVKKLNLAPDQHSDPIVKQILSGCHSAIEGLSSLRNRYGDAHGKGGTSSLPSTRHSALAVNLAGSVATFLVQSYEEKEYGTNQALKVLGLRLICLLNRAECHLFPALQLELHRRSRRGQI